MAWIEHFHADARVLKDAVVRQLEASTREALATRGHALLGLAGGRTPLPVYEALAERALDWAKVTALPTDDRCVPHAHPACNATQVRAALRAADGVRLEPLTTPDGDPGRSESHARQMLAHLPQPFDAVVLGMGNDAHTASLFPGAPNLAMALDPAGAADVCRIDPDPLPVEAPFPRITLTASRLLRAGALLLLVTGEAKRAVLEQVQQAGSDALRQPIAAFLHAPGAVVHIHWSP